MANNSNRCGGSSSLIILLARSSHFPSLNVLLGCAVLSVSQGFSFAVSFPRISAITSTSTSTNTSNRTSNSALSPVGGSSALPIRSSLPARIKMFCSVHLLAMHFVTSQGAKRENLLRSMFGRSIIRDGCQTLAVANHRVHSFLWHQWAGMESATDLTQSGQDDRHRHARDIQTCNASHSHPTSRPTTASLSLTRR